MRDKTIYRCLNECKASCIVQRTIYEFVTFAINLNNLFKEIDAKNYTNETYISTNILLCKYIIHF